MHGILIYNYFLKATSLQWYNYFHHDLTKIIYPVWILIEQKSVGRLLNFVLGSFWISSAFLRLWKHACRVLLQCIWKVFTVFHFSTFWYIAALFQIVSDQQLKFSNDASWKHNLVSIVKTMLCVCIFIFCDDGTCKTNYKCGLFQLFNSLCQTSIC